MQKLLLGVLICVMSGLSTFSCQAQQIVPQPLDSGELITPVNAQPLSIDAASRRRGIVTSAPAKNLIIFSCSGLSGASAAFYDINMQRQRDAMPWQGFQLVHPAWTTPGKPGRFNMIKAFSQFGKRISLISDKDFTTPGFIYGFANKQPTDLSMFNVALTFSDHESLEERREIVRSASGDSKSAGFDFASLGGFFRNTPSRYTGCYYTSAAILPGSRSRNEPWIPELVSSLVGRMATIPEGFCLVVNYSGVSESRSLGQFCRMLEHLRYQEIILRQLETFVASRKDTLLLVVDEPENGIWQTGEEFMVDDFVADLRKIPLLIKDMADNFVDVESKVQHYFPRISLSEAELAKAVAEQNVNKFIAAIELAVSKKHQIKFVTQGSFGFNSGLTILAQGLNADVFFGISSFPVFFKRLAVAVGLEATVEQSGRE